MEKLNEYLAIDKEIDRIQDSLECTRSRYYVAKEDLKDLKAKLDSVSSSYFWREYNSFKKKKDTEIKALPDYEVNQKRILVHEINEKREETLEKIEKNKSYREYLKNQIKEIEEVYSKAETELHVLEGEFEVAKRKKEQIHSARKNNNTPK